MRYCITLALILALARPVSAPAALPVIDAAAIVQLLLMKAEEIKQYADMLKNSGRFVKLPWARIEQYLSRAQEALRFGHSIAWKMQNADAEFRRRFPGYGRIKFPYQQSYQEWNKTAFDTMAQVMKAVNEHRRGMDDETGIINDLSSSVLGADGRLKAMQVTAQLAGTTAQQIIQLREVIIEDVAAKNAYQAAMLQKDAVAEAGGAHYFSFTLQQDKGNESFAAK